jgi:regulator of RNase E activity RraA
MRDDAAAVSNASIQELCRRFERLYTGAVADVLDELGYHRQTLPAAIGPLAPAMRLAGTALTVVGEATTSDDPEVIFVPLLQMLGAVQPGQVIVSQPNDTVAAHFGELSAETVRFRGGQGAVLDGGCRDVDYIQRLGLPVFCRYRTPTDIVGRWRLTATNVPIRIGQVDIQPGDMVIGDKDGVVVVPHRVTRKVLERAEEVAATENLVRKAILDGVHPLDAYRAHGRFYHQQEHQRGPQCRRSISRLNNSRPTAPRPRRSQTSLPSGRRLWPKPGCSPSMCTWSASITRSSSCLSTRSPMMGGLTPACAAGSSACARPGPSRR